MPRRKLTGPSRVEKELFRKRRLTLFNKANAMAQCGADVYVVIRRYGKFYTYKNLESSEWPPSGEKITAQRRVVHLGPADFAKKTMAATVPRDNSPQQVKSNNIDMEPNNIDMDPSNIDMDPSNIDMDPSNIDMKTSDIKLLPLSIVIPRITESMERREKPTRNTAIRAFPVSDPPVLHKSPAIA